MKYYAIILQVGVAPIKKRLPDYFRDIPVMLRALRAMYPNGMICVVNNREDEIDVWSPQEIDDMVMAYHSGQASRVNKGCVACGERR